MPEVTIAFELTIFVLGFSRSQLKDALSHLRMIGGPGIGVGYRSAATLICWFPARDVLFLNTSAGISTISQASPITQDISQVSAVGAALDRL
jgi:hypothetical protein